LQDKLPPDALFVIRHTHLEAFVDNHLPESKERMTSALSRLLWLACNHNQQLDDEKLEHPYIRMQGNPGSAAHSAHLRCLNTGLRDL
jgi:hypothetical protein